MTNSSHKNDSIEAEAASWVAQLDSGLQTDADRIALREWMARSPRHAAELKSLAELWGDIDIAVQLNIEQNNDTTASFGSFLSAWVRVKPRQVYTLVSLLLVMIVGSSFLINGQYFDKHFQHTYSVATGEQQEIELIDGSKLHLNTDSVVEVHYTSKHRRLRLLKGEAHFDVKHDAKRPFEVHAGPSLVTAIGTAFSVRLKPNDISVIVTEGRVRLSDAKASVNLLGNQDASQVAVVSDSVIGAGESASVDFLSLEVSISQDTSMDRKRRLAWRDGLVIFQNDSLQHVIDEVARYTSVSIVIADASIRDKRFSGMFRTGEVVALLGALQSSFGINVEYADNNVVYLTRQLDDSSVQ